MLKFDRILVPVDFSQDSLAALHYALALASKLQGPQTLTVLHIIDEGLPLSVDTSSVGSQARREGERQLKKVATKELERFIATIDPGEEVLETAVVVGRPASRRICRYAEDRGYDMIVIGSQGKGALERLVLGSTMQSLQRRATIPVLAVKNPADLAPPSE